MLHGASKLNRNLPRCQSLRTSYLAFQGATCRPAPGLRISPTCPSAAFKRRVGSRVRVFPSAVTSTSSLASLASLLCHPAFLSPSCVPLPLASLDRTVRLWDLAAGLPLAASRPHGGTVRCLALDTSLLASGCSDAAVRVWHPTRGNGPNRSNGDGGRPALLYDVASQPYVLRGHTGPVSCLALGSSGLYDSDGCDSTASTPRSTGSSGAYGGGLFHRRRKQGGGWGYGNGIGSGSSSSSMIFSGSWDCTVRIWRRSADLDGGHWGEGGREEGNGDEGGEQEEQERAGGNPAHRLSSSVGSAASSASSLAAGLTINGLSPSSSGSLASGVSSGSGSGSSGDELAAGLGGPGGGLRRGGRTKKRDESGGWGCTGVLQYSDWVYCCVARGANLLVAAGSEVVVTDACTGRCVRRFAALHEAGSVAAVEGTRNGRLLFTASADGLVLAHDLRMKQVGVASWGSLEVQSYACSPVASSVLTVVHTCA